MDKFDIEANKKFLANFPARKPSAKKRPRPEVHRPPVEDDSVPQLGNANSASLQMFVATFTDPTAEWRLAHRDPQVVSVLHMFKPDAGKLHPGYVVVHNHKFNEPCLPWLFCRRLGTDPNG